MVKYKNDYKPLSSSCLSIVPHTIISINGSDAFMTNSFVYHDTPIVGKVAIGFYYYPVANASTVPLIGNIGDFSSELDDKTVTISNGPWNGDLYAFPPNFSFDDGADFLTSAAILRYKDQSTFTQNWKITSLTTPDPPTALAVGKETVISYAFTTVSGDYLGTLASEDYKSRFASTVRQTGEVPTDSAEFETYLGQLGLSADANNAVSGYITSSAYSAGIAPPGGTYTAYDNDRRTSPSYLSSSFFSDGDVSFRYESPCTRLNSIRAAEQINFGYYASFQGPTP